MLIPNGLFWEQLPPEQKQVYLERMRALLDGLEQQGYFATLAKAVPEE